MDNVAQLEIKINHTDTLEWQTTAYRDAKRLGWRCANEEMHPTDRVPVFRLAGANIRRDRSGQADWVAQINGGEHLINHADLGELTAELLVEPEADPFDAIDDATLRSLAQDLVGDGYDQGRAIRGALIVADDMLDIVEQDASHVGAICQPSPGNRSAITGAPYYQVDKNALGWSCDCPDNQYNDETCKHILAAIITRRRDTERRELAARKMADLQDRAVERKNGSVPADKPLNRRERHELDDLRTEQDDFDSVAWALKSQQPRGAVGYAQGGTRNTWR